MKKMWQGGSLVVLAIVLTAGMMMLASNRQPAFGEAKEAKLTAGTTLLGCRDPGTQPAGYRQRQQQALLLHRGQGQARWLTTQAPRFVGPYQGRPGGNQNHGHCNSKVTKPAARRWWRKPGAAAARHPKGRLMNLTLKLLGVLAVLLLSVHGAPAQVVGAAGYNPYTGYDSRSAAGYNPYTGTAATGKNAYNPYTGTHAQSKDYYNPATGSSAQVQKAYNPYTGKSAYHYTYQRR